MPTYTALIHPGSNRVYGQLTPILGAAELATISTLMLDDRIQNRRIVERGGAPFVDFDTVDELTEADRRLLVNLSASYVLFEVHDGLLAPLSEGPLAQFPDDLLTIQKYAGKTNEQFTGLLLNLALAAARPGFADLLEGTRLRVFDPLCGRGTTLNQALRYGCDAVGIEGDRKDVEAYLAFIKRYLETNRVKHKCTKHRGQSGGHRTMRVTYSIDATRDRAVEPQVLDVINDDTTYLRDHLKGSSVHVIVTDLPYGIQHRAGTETWGASRNPATLLRDALPTWRGALRGGGSICLSYNTHIISRGEVDTALEDAGFTIVSAVTDGRFSHRVDQSIQRDLSLATKPA